MAKSAKQSSKAGQQRRQTGKKTERSRSVRKKKKVDWKFPLSRTNFIVAAVGVLIILIGFALMSTGISDGPAVPDGKWNNVMAVSVAPILLVIGYCVIIPFAIIKFFGSKGEESKEA